MRRLSGSEMEHLYQRYHRLECLAPDPLLYARGYEDARDGEVAGLIASALAYGRVGQIMRCLAWVFRHLGDHPARLIGNATARELRSLSRGFCYRFQKEKDLALYLWLLHQALQRWDSLAAMFTDGDPGDDLGVAIARFAERLRAGDPRPILRTREIPPRHPVLHLLASPSGGGASKRMCLFLRWMVRRDRLDPGYWSGVMDPSRLVIPLDTHVARVSRRLRFTSRATADWKTAQEITRALRQYDPADPLRFDFCLFRFGMSGGARS